MPVILYDQSNEAYRMGTGIATYARNLVLAARGAGYGADALLSADVEISVRNPVLSEVRLFEGREDPLSRWMTPAFAFLHGMFHAPFGFSALHLEQPDVVVRPPGAPPKFDHLFVRTRLFEAAQVHFMLFRRLARVRLPTPPALFHATHLLPVRIMRAPNIVTIHDLVPLRLPYMTLDDKRYFYHLTKRLVAEADHIVTVSEYSRRDIIKVFGVPESRITNTYQASVLPPRVLARSDDDVADEVSHLFELEPREYYLFLGALEPKKNVRRLIDAYAASGSRRPLVIAGGLGWLNEREQERIKDPRFTYYRLAEATISKYERVRRLSFLPFAQLVALMRGARALLFPSVYEGFGLPVLEAMSLGTPVMTANTTSLPEVAGDAALLVDPYDVPSMARAIRRLDNDADLLADLAERGRRQAERFSLAAYQSRIEELYGRVLGGSRRGLAAS